MNNLNNFCLGKITCTAIFLGFSVKPFELPPDPRFFYQTPGAREIIATMISNTWPAKGKNHYAFMAS
jgi:hypothetical protein